jgi:hypothetical protein
MPYSCLWPLDQAGREFVEVRTGKTAGYEVMTKFLENDFAGDWCGVCGAL